MAVVNRVDHGSKVAIMSSVMNTEHRRQATTAEQREYRLYRPTRTRQMAF